MLHCTFILLLFAWVASVLAWTGMAGAVVGLAKLVLMIFASLAVPILLVGGFRFR